METHLQHTFSVAEAKAKYDAYVKELLADKEILDKIPVFGNISKAARRKLNAIKLSNHGTKISTIQSSL